VFPGYASQASRVKGTEMAKARDLEAKLWKALKSDMTVMLGLVGVDNGHARPMTAQIEKGRRAVWFFTSRDNSLVGRLSKQSRAVATFASKGHDLFATIHGQLRVDNDRAVIDRLWNRFVAAWFEGGKDDPKLTLLRFDPDNAEVWLDASSIFAGIKMLLGVDPKESFKDKVGVVSLKSRGKRPARTRRIPERPAARAARRQGRRRPS